MTVREVAKQFGCSPETVKGHIRDLFPGLMQNGKTTYLTPPQVTIILEKMKQGAENIRGNQYRTNEESSTYKARLVGTETSLTPLLQIELLQREKDAINDKIQAIKDAEIARLNDDLAAATRLLERRTAGLETIQRIAEAGGLIMSDRDDVTATYRRR
jgi:hypothetical protein